MPTARQKRMLEFIVRRHATTGIYPSVREIARAMGFASTNTVAYHMKKLEEAGYVQRSRQARSYTVLVPVADASSRQQEAASPRLRAAQLAASPTSSAADEPSTTSGLPQQLSPHDAPTPRAGRRSLLRPIPILGRVAAGQPLSAEQNYEGTLELHRFFDTSSEIFALRVRGDSMIEEGILDGDLVIVRCQPSVENGEIGVAIIDDEATVKRIYDDGDTWRLVPANSAMQPIVVAKGSAQLRIAGKVVGVVRKLR